jgi:hypothetical protein
MSPRLKTLSEEEREKILKNVVARYRELCASGFGRIARSSAIKQRVPARFRTKKSGDRDWWWERLAEALRPIRARAAEPPPEETGPIVVAVHPPPTVRSARGRPRDGYWWERH